MKGQRPQLQRLRRIVSFGFFAAVAGVFLFVPAPGLHAGNVPAPALQAGNAKGPPPWVPFELKAINLLNAGLREENFDPQSAINTLRQARIESTAAITNGGGAIRVVMHNDYVIAEALIYAQTGVASTENNQAPQNQTNGGNNRATSTNRATPVISHSPVRVFVRR